MAHDRTAARVRAAVLPGQRGAAGAMLQGAEAEREGRDDLAGRPPGPDAPQPAGERRNPGGVQRYGHRHSAGRPPQDFRAVFHDQAAGPGHGSRPVGRIRHRRRASRPHRGRIADGCGNQLQGVPSSRMKILVVEDDKTVGDYVRRGLDEAGYHVELVGDGDEGLRRASGRGANYDIMVLDLRLPTVSGIDVLRTLRDRGVGLPVLVLTAQDSVDFKVQALRMGADDYVTKPFAFEERSEEHTSELQSRLHLVCRLLLEKKKKKRIQL